MNINLNIKHNESKKTKENIDLKIMVLDPMNMNQKIDIGLLRNNGRLKDLTTNGN